MSANNWSTAVPSDTELRAKSLRASLWAALLAYSVYILALIMTAEAGFLVPFLLLCAGLHCLALVAFYLGKTLVASVWMILVVLLCFTLMNTLGFSKEQSAEYYYILVPALIFMVLPPERREWQNTLLTLAIALLTLTFIVPGPSQPWYTMTEEEYFRFKWLDILVCFLCLAVVSRNFIQRLLQQRSQLERLALTDTLTGLPNRHGILQRLAQWYNQGRRFSVLLLDVDDFRQINRRSGHDVGDILMRKLAQRLRADIGDDIAIGRVAGDQFMMATDQIIEAKALMALAKRVQTSVSRTSFDLNGRTERIGISIGATSSADREQPQDLTNRLAQALRMAREQNNGQIHLLEPEINPVSNAGARLSASAKLATRY